MATITSVRIVQTINKKIEAEDIGDQDLAKKHTKEIASIIDGIDTADEIDTLRTFGALKDLINKLPGKYAAEMEACAVRIFEKVLEFNKQKNKGVRKCR